MSPPAAWRELYPFESHELRIGGHRYHYLDEGSPGHPALLLLHGNPTWSFYWRRLVLAWRDRYRLVVPDHLGCGLSDKPQDYDYRLARHIENALALVEALDLEQITLLAHDWGGAIGMGAAVRQPDRFARFVLFNTAAFRSRRMPWRIRLCRTPGLGTLAVRGLNAFVRGALRWATARPQRFTPQVRAGYRAPYDSWAHRVAIDRFVRDIPLHAGHPSYALLEDIERGLSRLADRPALLVWGMRDWCFTPEFLERFLELLPQAEVLRIADAGHLVVEDAHEQVARRVAEFFAQHPLPPRAAAGE